MVDALEVGAGDLQLGAYAGSDAEEDRFEALIQEVVDADVLSHRRTEDELDPQLFEQFRLVVADVVVHLERRDAVAHDAAGARPGVVDRHTVSLPGQQLGDGETRGTGAHHGRSVTGGRLLLLGDAAVGLQVVRGEGFEPADRHRSRALLDVDARSLTLDDLRAHASAHLGERAGLTEDPRRLLELAVLDVPERQRNVVVQGTCLDALRSGALDAALGGGSGGLLVERKVYLVEVGASFDGILLRDYRIRKCHPRFSIDLLWIGLRQHPSLPSQSPGATYCRVLVVSTRLGWRSVYRTIRSGARWSPGTPRMEGVEPGKVTW